MNETSLDAFIYSILYLSLVVLEYLTWNLLPVVRQNLIIFISKGRVEVRMAGRDIIIQVKEGTAT